MEDCLVINYMLDVPYDAQTRWIQSIQIICQLHSAHEVSPIVYLLSRIYETGILRLFSQRVEPKKRTTEQDKGNIWSEK